MGGEEDQERGEKEFAEHLQALEPPVVHLLLKWTFST